MNSYGAAASGHGGSHNRTWTGTIKTGLQYMQFFVGFHLGIFSFFVYLIMVTYDIHVHLYLRKSLKIYIIVCPTIKVGCVDFIVFNFIFIIDLTISGKILKVWMTIFCIFLLANVTVLQINVEILEIYVQWSFCRIYL